MTGFEELKKKNFLHTIPLQTRETDGGIILPDKDRLGGVVDSRFNFVPESAFRYGDLTLWGGAYDIDEAVEEIAETVIFIGHMQRHWGNFLFDCMTRIWYALREPAPYRLAYCGIQTEENALGNPNTRYGEFMRLLGMEADRFIDIRKPTGFSKVIIPELSAFPGTFYTEEFAMTFDRVIANVNRLTSYESYDKIYLTRRQMAACKELGEKEIETIFRELGYQVIAPEKLEVAEQVYLFSHCKSFASIEGTTSHNILFAQDGTEHIILRKQDYTNTRQLVFDRLKHIAPEYIDVYYEPFRGFPLSHDMGPFYIGVTSSLYKWVKERAYSFSMSDKVTILYSKIRNFFVYTLKCIYYKYWLYR